MNRGTVVAYHGIADCAEEDDPNNLFVSVAAFERQMAFLARKRTVVELDELMAGVVTNGPPAVAITFDDGYRSVLTTAAPILQRYGFKATVFVPTAWIGDRNRWNPPTPAPLDIMSEDELRGVESLGVRVESHGHAHIDLTKANEFEARSDLHSSRAIIERVVGRAPQYLAYPFRTASLTAQRIAEETGFVAAFSIDLPDAGRYAYARVQVSPPDSLPLFALKTSGHYMRMRHSAVLSAGYEMAKVVGVGRRRFRARSRHIGG